MREDLAGESLIAPPVGHPSRATTERVMAGVPWENAVEALGYELAVQFVGYGMGVTIINDFFHEGARWVAEQLSTNSAQH